MIDRWGNSGTIFSWEILNEADLWWGANPAQLRAWIDDVAGFTRQYEKQKWGRNHMISTSFAEAMPKGELGTLAYTSPALDYATTHLYIGASKAPKEAVGPALALRQGVEHSIGLITDNRPYMDTENGPIDGWIESAVLDDEVFHGMIWAHLASGGAGSGFRWPYRNPHHLTEGMLAHLKRMSQFVPQVPWKTLSGKYVPVVAEGDKGAATSAFGTASSAIAWTSGGGPLRVRWSGPAKVRCRVFDTRTGQWMSDAVVTARDGAYEIAGKAGSFVVLLTKV
jgi:mannan endo-1,4-beta-mannosidase